LPDLSLAERRNAVEQIQERVAVWARKRIDLQREDLAKLEKASAQLFEQAADVFLFAALPEGAKLKDKVVPAQTGREVSIAVHVRPDIAGVPFEFAFSLPV